MKKKKKKEKDDLMKGYALYNVRFFFVRLTPFCINGFILPKI